MNRNDYNSEFSIIVRERDANIFTANIKTHELSVRIPDFDSSEFFTEFDVREIRHFIKRMSTIISRAFTFIQPYLTHKVPKIVRI